RVDWQRWMRSLGRQNRHVREFLGLSQEEVAQLAGVSQGAVSRLEAGRGLSTPMLVVLKIYLALGRALRTIDPVLRDDVRTYLEPPLAEELEEGKLPEPALDPDLVDLVRLYRGLRANHRRTLLSVMRAASSSLSEAPPPRRASASAS